MSDGFVEVPIADDEEQLVDDAVDRLAAIFPGWVPREGHLEMAVLEECARIAAELRRVAADVPGLIFAGFGAKLVDTPREEGAPATAASQWTMVDDAGYTIPEGTVVGYQVTGDEQIAFETVEALEVAPGATQGTVDVQAREVGTHANGLAAAALVLVDALAFVDSVATTEETSGGVEPESTADYLDRLAQTFTTLTPRPILPDDFAILARDVTGVHRALVRDQFDPADGSSDNERMVAVAAVDENGDAIDTATKDELQSRLADDREVNFVVNTMDPEYTGVDVAVTVVAAEDADPADLQTAVEDALTEWLSPARWGGGDQTPPVWELTDTVRHLAAVAIAGNVPGVAYVKSLTLDGGTADVTLSGHAPLPAPTDHATDPSSVTVTVE